MVFGENILCELFKTFENATPIQNVINYYSKKYPYDLVIQIIEILLKNRLIVEDEETDIQVTKICMIKH